MSPAWSAVLASGSPCTTYAVWGAAAADESHVVSPAPSAWAENASATTMPARTGTYRPSILTARTWFARRRPRVPAAW